MNDAKKLIEEMVEEIENCYGRETELSKKAREYLSQSKIGEWILCSEQLPEVPEGIEDDNCPEFNVTIKGDKEATTLRCDSEGTWFDDNGYVYPVIAWSPLPEAYHEGLGRK